jgi:hypothetical protein
VSLKFAAFVACNKYGLAALSDNSLMVSLSWGCLVKHLGELCAGNRKCGSMRAAGAILSFILFAESFLLTRKTQCTIVFYTELLCQKHWSIERMIVRVVVWFDVT